MREGVAPAPAWRGGAGTKGGGELHHRDSLNKEIEIRWVFYAPQLCKIFGCREDLAAPLAVRPRRKNCFQRLALRPGGTPQEISRGPARAAGVAPGWAAERAMPQRGIEEVFGGVLRAAFPPPRVASGPFLRCPAGARSHMARFPGAASAGADLPPANLLRRPSGTGTGSARAQCGGSAQVVRRSSACSAARLPPHAVRPGTARSPLRLRPRRPVFIGSLRCNSVCPQFPETTLKEGGAALAAEARRIFPHSVGHVFAFMKSVVFVSVARIIRGSARGDKWCRCVRVGA